MNTFDAMSSTPNKYYPVFPNFAVGSSEAETLENSGTLREVELLYPKRLSSLSSRLNPTYLSDARKKQINRIKLNEISNLEFDWNENGVEPFSKELISITNAIFNDMERQPKIFPTARHSIQFEYENEYDD